MHKRVLSVIGAGASGLAAAIEAARLNDNIEINIYERLDRPGKKILVSGNGRCNIMNESASALNYCGDGKFISEVFAEFPPESNAEFFKSMGLLLTKEDDGRLYPMSFQSSAVLDALRFEAEKLNINIICKTKITNIKRHGGGFTLNNSVYTDALIAAGGGKSMPVHGSDGSCFSLLADLGIKITPLFPSLTGICLKKKNTVLKGTRANGEISIISDKKVIGKSLGEIQYTDYGVSGIPSMEVSRSVSEHFAKRRESKIYARINSLPDFSPEEIRAYINERKNSNPGLMCENLLTGVMPKRLGMTKNACAGIGNSMKAGELSDGQIDALVKAVTAETTEISAVLGFEHSQVTAGGADTACFSPHNLMAKKLPGLFACGEALNVDGRCGGYNLSWAWSSGRCAGKGAAKYLSEKK